MISIIMIVYDVERYVEESIKSVLAQTYRDIELIIVCGHGADRSEEICRKWAGEDSRIKLITCPANGIADARNRGMAEVTGDYLGFVDSDDYIEPEMFESMLGNMEKYSADIAVCGRFYEYVNTTLHDEAASPRVMTGAEAVAVTLGHDGFFLHCWDKLYSRKIFEGLTFRTDITVEDRIVVDALLSKADKVVYDPTPMYHFRERSGSNSKRSGMVRKNIEADVLMEEFLRKNHPELANETDNFMLYEYVTAIQNELAGGEPDADDLNRYRDKVRALSKTKNPLVSRSLKIKVFMALRAPAILAAYTKTRQAEAASTLERFP
ncbi:MAG: glycosyltransferase [Lachnospiraceae bacterium]|nr:glycosyltransferase [Lachnospiraceae bacterium]